MYCTRCGQPLQPGTRFCPRCGQPAPVPGPGAPQATLRPAPAAPPPLRQPPLQQPGQVPAPWGSEHPATWAPQQPPTWAAPPAARPSRRLAWPLLAAAAVVAVAVAAAWFLVVPRFAGGEALDDGSRGVVPSQARPPVGAFRQQGIYAPLLPGARLAADAGLLVLGTPELDESYSATPVWTAVGVQELAGARTLWSADLGRSVCALGRPNTLLCLDGSQARSYDLRSGAARTVGAVGPLPGRLLAYPDGTFVTLSWTPGAGGASGSVAQRSLTLTGYDAGARQRWARSLVVAATSDDPMLGFLAGDIAVFVQGQDRLSATQRLASLAYLRDPATGEPLPGVPDGVGATELPGRRLLVRTAAGFDVLDAQGRAVVSVPDTPAATFEYVVNDGSLQAFVVRQPADSTWTVHGLDGSSWTTPDRPLALCGGVLVAAPVATGGTPSRVRIARDLTGAERWRLTVPAATDPNPSVVCDGERVIELGQGQGDGTPLIAYSAGAVTWQTEVGGDSSQGWFLWGARYEGIALVRASGDVHYDLVVLRQD